ncbi:MAG: hypothetical protein ACREQ5_29675, partial [Candidatus Dormibacteria bacterium]
VSAALAQTTLSDIPLFSATNVPANLMLALSVEFPTGTVAAYTDNKIPLVFTDSSGNIQIQACGGHVGGYGVCYFPAMHYLGYFDYAKCYDYDSTKKYFVPFGSRPSGTNPTPPDCTGHWSGNMLNWASMTALDEFRQTLTGGYRVIDQAGLTVLQRSRQTAQGSASNCPSKHLDATDNVNPSSVVGDSTFNAATDIFIRSHNGSTELIDGSGNRGVFIEVADNAGFVNDPSNGSNDVLYYARAQVCVPGLLEPNCNSAHAAKDYPGAGTYDKPEGLIQQNYQRIRVGATGYLYAFGEGHPNGVLRALLHDNGPTTYNGFGARQPNTSTSNPGGEEEWDPSSGIFTANPDPTSASASSVSLSGAINYLNQFGLNEPGYETQDTLAELYWAT